MNYIEADDKNFGKLKRKLIENKKIFQFVYWSVYLEVYSFVDKRGVDMRNNFHLKFKEWKDRKKYSQKSIEGNFSKAQIHHLLQVLYRKSLLAIRTLRKKKKIAEEQKQKEMEEEKRKEGA